jgi:hypothetical protein
MHPFSPATAAIGLNDLFGWTFVVGAVLYMGWSIRAMLQEQRRSQGKPPREPVEKSHSMLGSYSDREYYWVASVASPLGVDGRLEISAAGPDPSEDQLSKLEDIQSRLPGFFEALAPFFSLPPADGQGVAVEGLRLADCKLVHLAGSEDGSFHARLRAGQFDFTLSIETDAEGKLTYYGSQSAAGYSVPGPCGARGTEQSPELADFRAKLPEFLQTLAPLVAAAENDGWGHSLPGFDLATAKVEHVCLREDHLFEVSLSDTSGRDYLIGLRVLINRDGKVVEYLWSI